MPVIEPAELKSFAIGLLQAGGFTRDDATQTADLLVWANVRGVDSHGVLRIPRYIEMVQQGVVVSGGTVKTVRENGAIVVLDGGKCPGAVGMNAAVERAALLATKHGIGWCSARAISHAGAVGYFSSTLARRGFVGIVMTASKPLMGYFGSKGEGISTNPLSIAVPVGGAEPILLDMSTAAVALGKIMEAKDAGKEIPLGWAVDAAGVGTTDPHKVAALLPMARAKGSGLSLMIEALVSVLAGNAVIAPVLLGRKKGGFNGVAIALDPQAFGDRLAFESAMSELADAIHALPPAEGVETVLLPGEGSASVGRKRVSDGIPLADGTVEGLVEIARRLDVPVPPSLGDLLPAN